MNQPARPPNFRDIAAKAGVSTASVSLALRNDPQISPPVRARIRQAAKELGYRPNPLLSAYQASVRSKQPKTFQATLGWINDHPDSNAWSKPWLKPYWDGAKARAEELGYQMDEIWVPGIRIETPEENMRKIQRILRARGILGVILPGLERAHHAVLPWEGFTVVCIGRHHLLVEKSTIQLQQIHEHNRVCPNYLFNTQLIIRKLLESGCKRIGLAISPFGDQESDYAMSSAYLRRQLDMPTSRRLPILFSTNAKDAAIWARKHRPDAVICNHPETVDGIRQSGFRIPEDVRIAHTNLAKDVEGWSGIDCRAAVIGSAAVDMLTAHLIRNENGVPVYAKEMSIEGEWIEGTT